MKDIHIEGIDKATVRAALREFQSELQKVYMQSRPEIMIYGSQARGEANPTSDVDVLLLFSSNFHPGEEIRRLGPILADLNLRYQVLISILPAKEDDYIHAAGMIWKNIRREGIPVDRV
jgi:predicted nucleotidyltransferase